MRLGLTGASPQTRLRARDIRGREVAPRVIWGRSTRLLRFPIRHAEIMPMHAFRPALHLAIAGVLAVAGACSSEDSAAKSRNEPPPSAAGVEANRAVLSGVPQVPGANLFAQNEVGPPKGGRGEMSYFYYAAPEIDRGQVIAHFRSALDGWAVHDERSTATRSTLTFVKGDAWVSVTASEVSADGLTKVPGYVVAVDASDAAVLTARSSD